MKTISSHNNTPIISDYRNLIAFFTVFLFGLLAYANSFSADFQFDDYDAIVNNSLIKNFDISVFWGHYKTRFLTNLTFVINYSFGGLNVFGWHLMNLTIHIFASYFVYLLTRITFQTPKLRGTLDNQNQHLIALFCSLVFCVHPIQTQAVTYIVQRATSLATLFYLGTLYFYIKTQLSQRRAYYIAAVLSFILGMLTKPIVITLPIIIILYSVLFFERKKRTESSQFLLFIFFCIPTVLIPLFLFGKGKLVWEATKAYQKMPGASYLLTQFNVFMTYIRLLFLPINQNLDYDYPISNGLFEFPTYLSALAIIAILAIAFRLIKNNRLLSFGIFWFFITLSPQSSIFPLQDVIYEHRVYLGFFGFAVFLCMGLWKMIQNRKIYIAVMCLIVGSLTVLTYMRNSVWSDSLTFLEDVVKKSPNKARPHNNLGFYYFQKGKYLKAEAQYSQAIRADENYFIAYDNLGMVYLELDRLEEAEDIFRESIKRNPVRPEPYIGLGSIYEKLNDYQEAAHWFSRAALYNPNPGYAPLDIGWGNLYFKQGLLDKAKSSFKKAISLDPQNATTHYNLGNVCLHLNDYYGAIYYYRRAIELKPDFAKAFNNIGNIYSYYLKDYSNAIKQYNKAIDANPSLAEAHFNLANTLHTLGDHVQARRHAKMALDLYRLQGRRDMLNEIEEKLSEP